MDEVNFYVMYRKALKSLPTKIKNMQANYIFKNLEGKRYAHQQGA